ncbi:N-acetylmuramoyl-L-alanine amidase [Alphaproteobacteria bacterium]|nr:N-acetylmuramoyl-L-alanine amidase [Alphaproteobacteria bacterium]
MKLIHNFKSPNFNDRKSNNVEIIVIHYTALDSISNSLKYLCSKKNKVSSHYLISQSGKIYSLVSEKKRAWHAGQSYWKGNTDINSISIGIELDHSPSDKNNKFTLKLNSALIFLLKKILKKYRISTQNILGHSDIAPYRKKDPGKYFPWQMLENKKLSYRVQHLNQSDIKKSLKKKWSNKKKLNSMNKKILFMLNFIGYDTSLALKNKFYFDQLINAYSSHYRIYKNYYYNKKKIFYVIEVHFLNIILTKNKK